MEDGIVGVFFVFPKDLVHNIGEKEKGGCKQGQKNQQPKRQLFEIAYNKGGAALHKTKLRFNTRSGSIRLHYS